MQDITGRLVTKHKNIKYIISGPEDPEIRYKIAMVRKMFRPLQQENPTYNKVRSNNHKHKRESKG